MSYLEWHEHNEISDELMNSSEVKLFICQRLLGDEGEGQHVEQAVLQGQVQHGLIVLQDILCETFPGKKCVY